MEAGDESVNYAGLADDAIEADIKVDAIKTKGYFIYPSHLFVNVVAGANSNSDLNTDLAALVSDAATEVARFDSEHGGVLLPFGPLLLRSEAAASSQIENLTSSAKAISVAEVSGSGPTNAKLNVSNVTAMKAALEQAGSLDSSTIIDIHSLLLGESRPSIVGKWREEQVWVGGTNVGPHLAEFVPPRHGKLAVLMDDLSAFMDRNDISPFVHAAITHAQFETIHPFPDGNGRTGRALIHAMFVAKGLTQNVAIPLSAGLLTDTDKYFDSLSRYRAGDIEEIIRQLAVAIFSSISNAKELVSEVANIQIGWNDRVAARKDSTAARLLSVLAQQPAVTSKTVEDAFGVAPVNALAGIEKLVDADVLRLASPSSRNRVWIAHEIISELDNFAERAGRRG